MGISWCCSEKQGGPRQTRKINHHLILNLVFFSRTEEIIILFHAPCPDYPPPPPRNMRKVFRKYTQTPGGSGQGYRVLLLHSLPNRTLNPKIILVDFILEVSRISCPVISWEPDQPLLHLAGEAPVAPGTSGGLHTTIPGSVLSSTNNTRPMCTVKSLPRTSSRQCRHRAAPVKRDAFQELPTGLKRKTKQSWCASEYHKESPPEKQAEIYSFGAKSRPKPSLS